MESLRDLSLNHTPLMTHNYPGLVVLAYDPLTTGPSRQTEEGRAKAPPFHWPMKSGVLSAGGTPPPPQSAQPPGVRRTLQA
jgi:hypothetical protein